MMYARGKSGMTDKPTKDIMTRKFTDSSDSSRDSDSESVSSFVALPEEFRPNLNVRKLPATEDKDFKISNELGRQHASQKPVGNKSTVSTSSNKALDSSKCGVSKDESTLSFQKRAMSRKSNCLSPPVCNNDRIKTSHRMERNKIICDGKEKTKIAGISVVKERGFLQESVNPMTKNQLEPRANNLNSFSNDVKQEKSLQYEYIKIHEQSALQVNFDMQSLNDTNAVAHRKLVYDAKLIAATSTLDKNESSANNEITNQNFPNNEKRSNLLDEEGGFLKQQGVVKWDSSLNLLHDEKLVKWTVVKKTETFTVRERKVADVSQLLHNAHISEEFNSDCSRPINFPPNNTNYKKGAIPKKFQKDKAMKRNYRTNKINSKNFPSKGNQHLNIDEKQKISYTVNKQNLYPTKEKLETEKSSCLGINTVSSKPSNSSSCCCPETKSPNSSQTDRQTVELRNNRTVQSPEREEKDDFTQFKKSSAEMNRPAKVPNFTQDKLVRNLDDINNQIICFGKDVSDLIIGSYTALNILISFYREWTQAHKELLDLLEQLEKGLKSSSEKFSTYSDILEMAKSGAKLAAVIPNPWVAAAANIVSIVASLMQTFVKTKEVDQGNTDDLDDIARVIFKKNQANADLLMYALQCSMQFEETAKLINDFHSKADIKNYSDPEQLAMTNFIRGILEYKPNHRIFYKKLYKCFQELIQSKATTLSKRFCEPFTLFSSSALDVIGHLNWRFQNEDFDCSSVSQQLEVMYNLIQNSTTTDVKALHRSVRSCISTIRDEMGFYENCFKDISFFDFCCDDINTTSIKKGF